MKKFCYLLAAFCLAGAGCSTKPPANDKAKSSVLDRINAPAPAELGVSGKRVGDTEALVFRVPFQPGSTDINLSPGARNTLAAITMRASKVQLESAAAEQQDANIAMARASAIRAFLVQRGVPAERIAISAPSSGGAPPQAPQPPSQHVDVVVVLSGA